jgi:hypothetical protein
MSETSLTPDQLRAEAAQLLAEAAAEEAAEATVPTPEPTPTPAPILLSKYMRAVLGLSQ